MNNSMAAVFLIIILLTAFSASAIIEFDDTKNVEVEVFDSSIKIETETTTYSQDEVVEMELTLVNNRDHEQTYEGSGSSHRANVWIYDSAGEEVWNNVPEFQDLDYDVIMVPAKSEFVLQTVFWPQVDHTGAKVNPGTYEIISMNDHTPAETGVHFITIS